MRQRHGGLCLARPSNATHCFHNNAGTILAQSINIGLDLVEALIHRVKLRVHEVLHGVELARDEFKLSRELGKRSVVLILLDVHSHAASTSDLKMRNVEPKATRFNLALPAHIARPAAYLHLACRGGFPRVRLTRVAPRLS